MEQVSPVLIGSRALKVALDSGNFWRRVGNDWDFIAPINVFYTILTQLGPSIAKIIPILPLRDDEKRPRKIIPYSPHLKYKLVLKTGAHMDFEIAEWFPSYQALREGAGRQLDGIEVEAQYGRMLVGWSVYVPPLTALFAHRLSLIYFPLHWRKNAQDLIAIKRFLNVNSTTEILANPNKLDATFGPNGPNLKELFLQRLKENYYVQKFLHGDPTTKKPPAMSAQARKRTFEALADNGVQIPSILEWEAPNAGERYEVEETTGVSVEWPRFLDLPERSHALIPLIMAVAYHHYLFPSGQTGIAALAASSLVSAEAAIRESYMLALQTIVTRQLTPIPSLDDLHAPDGQALGFWRSAVSVYDKATDKDIVAVARSIRVSEHASNTIDMQQTEVSAAIAGFKMGLDGFRMELEFLETEDLMQKVPAQDKFVEYFVDNLSDYFQIPAAWEKVVRALINVPAPQGLSRLETLPKEVLTHLMTHSITDHLTLARLSRVSQAMNVAYRQNAQRAWFNLLHRCFSHARLKPILEPKFTHWDKFDEQRDNPAMFQAVYTTLRSQQSATFNFCQHCGRMHATTTQAKFEALVKREEQRKHCVCPHCTASAGETCPYRDSFVFSS